VELCKKIEKSSDTLNKNNEFYHLFSL
jgi:hypothetical protein